MTVRFVDVKDGVSSRRLAVECWGDPDGIAVFLFHGTPGSRSGPRPRHISLYRMGINLISYDRPGYGQSERSRGRSVVDAVDDIRAIAAYLGLHEFHVVGRSGGGPHALACAAELPDMVKRAAVLVSLAPSDATDLDWYAEMAGSNVREYRNADDDQTRLLAELIKRTGRIQDDPEYLLEFLKPELARADRRVVEDPAMRRLLAATYDEALRYGPDGWIDDVLALRRPWGFDLSAIQARTLLWHGADDRFSPVSHTRWLAEQIPGSKVRIEHGAAHFGAFQVFPDVLAWLAAPTAPERPFQPVTAGLRH